MNVLPFLLIAGFAGAVICGLMRRIASLDDPLPLDAGWILELSLERYRPMLRLLETADLEFLRNQPDCSHDLVARVRVQRCQVFRGYLHSLKRDFARMCLALKMVLAESEKDRPELTAALFRQQFLFAASLIGVQCRLLLYRWGLAGVDVSGLVRIFDAIRLELQSRVPADLAREA